jgi:type IV pilus assembly protein PilW
VNSRRSQSQAGFTLVELLVGVVVSLVAIAAGVLMLQGQKRSFQGSSSDRALQETGRMVLGTVSQDLRLAGFGVEPAMVFDFGEMLNVPMDRARRTAGKTVTFGGNSAGTTGFACGTAVSCRDSIAGPDELAFQYRDPYFNHQIVSVLSGTSIQIAGPLRQPIRAGQVFQAVCFTGTMVWAYVRAASEVAVTEDALIPVTLEPGRDLDYPNQNEAIAPTTGDTCFSTGLARLFKVERFRYFVQSYDAAGQVVAWNAAGSRPYLMLDRGLRVNGAPSLEVVAPDVEDFQISYVFPLGAAGSQVAGATTGAALANDDAGIALVPSNGLVPTYASARLSPARGNHYPSNIRSVRVAIVARSPNVDSNLGDANIPAAGNRPTVSAGDPGFRRTTFETSVAIPNMEARAPFFPAIEPTSTVLNVGGG